MINLTMIRLLFYLLLKLSNQFLYNPNPYLKCGLPVDSYGQMDILFPWLVSIQSNYKYNSSYTHDYGHICGGSLISDRYVLTAAHCLQIPNVYMPHIETLNEYHTTLESLFRIKLNLKSFPFNVELNVKRIKIHEDFNSFNLLHDIALIELEYPLEFDSRVSSVCLPDMEPYGYPYEFEDATLQGLEDYTTFQNINRVSVRFTQSEHCNDYSVDEYQICAQSHVNAGVCRGDSGNGLVIKSRQCAYEMKCYVLAGITSFVLGKKSESAYQCSSNYPVFFTRVSRYTEWLRLNMHYTNEDEK